MITAEARKVETDNPVERLHQLVARDMALADKLIHENLGSTVSLIPELAKHLVDSGGKRLRPLLTLATAKMGGYEGKAHILLAAAVEFIHTATLLHDDVVDASALRRGKASANIVWGNKPSVLVGDFLFSRSFQLMVEAGDMEILGVLAKASAIIAEGEVMQLKATSNLATDEADYLRVVEAKTAALFSAAAQSGAMVSGRGNEFAQAFRSYGRDLGIAFQLADDALDYSGRQAIMGKSVGDDFREAKVTLPIVLAYERADDESRRFWRRTIESGQQHEGDLQRAIAIVEGTGAIEETLSRARRYVGAACDAIAGLPAGEIRSTLLDVAEFCVERAY